MKHEITTIPLAEITSRLPCETPDPKKYMVKEDEAAVRVMTDFMVVVPKTVRPHVSIDDALEKMKVEGVRMLLVSDEDHRITGIITSYDIQGEIPINYSRETGISHGKIKVEMIMTPLEQVPALHLASVEKSLVRHVVATMRKLEKHHVLIVAGDDRDTLRIRGMFSTSNINRCLGKQIHDSLYSAHTLAEIQKELTH